MVHTSLGKIGYVCGGAQAVIEALIETVGKEGTIMMPTQSWKNLDPETGVHWDADETEWDRIRENWPAYNKTITPTNTMGAVAEMFRSWPGAVRSDHPARSFTAWGRNAEYLTKNHDLSDIFGDTSPIGKLYDLDSVTKTYSDEYVAAGEAHDKFNALYKKLPDDINDVTMKNAEEVSELLQKIISFYNGMSEYEKSFIDKSYVTSVNQFVKCLKNYDIEIEGIETDA